MVVYIKGAEKMFVYNLYYFIDGKVVSYSGKVIVHKIVLRSSLRLNCTP